MLDNFDSSLIDSILSVLNCFFFLNEFLSRDTVRPSYVCS